MITTDRPTTMTEPPDRTLLLRTDPRWGTADAYAEAVYYRSDDGAREGGYGDQHWYLVEPTNSEYPMTWGDLQRDLAESDVLVRLHTDDVVRVLRDRLSGLVDAVEAYLDSDTTEGRRSSLLAMVEARNEGLKALAGMPPKADAEAQS